MNKTVLNKMFKYLYGPMSFFSKVRIDDRRYAEAAGLFVKNIRWKDVTIEGLQTTNYI